VFPLRDENPTQHVTWMNWLLIAANVSVFAYEIYLQTIAGPAALARFFTAWSFDPALLRAAPASPQVWLTVLTAMFLHAGWLHIGGNMLYLWVFGNNIEDRLGPWRYLAFYLACGVVAAVAQAFASGFVDVPTLGASGAVAGVLGAYVLLYPRARVLAAIVIVIFIELALIPAWVVIIVWFAIQLANGIATVGPAAPPAGVAYFAHVGGFLTGLLLIVPTWLRERGRSGFVAWR
jgi:membrane associated rhomboid family serine protease